MSEYEVSEIKTKLQGYLKDFREQDWESALTNLGVFFMEYGRPDISRGIWEFVCQHGKFTQITDFNLSHYYLNLVRHYTEQGIQSEPLKLDFSKLKEGAIHPDAVLNKLLKLRDILSQYHVKATCWGFHGSEE